MPDHHASPVITRQGQIRQPIYARELLRRMSDESGRIDLLTPFS
jgi:hypothetical protein